MKKLLPLLPLLICVLSSSVCAASPAHCYPATGITNMTVWNLASNWASSSGGTASTCAASGGTSVSYRGATMVIAAGVPGAGGSKDLITVPTGVTIHVSSGVSVQLGDPTSSATTSTIVSTGTGHIVVDDGGFLDVRGYDTIVNGKGLANLALTSIFQIMPGGAVYVDSADATDESVMGEWQNNGKFYVGCGDQTKAPTTDCAAVGNAGFWAHVSVASPGVWTAGLGTSIPASWNIGDLVEFDLIPQPVTTGTGAIGPPYAPFPCVTAADGYVSSCQAPKPEAETFGSLTLSSPTVTVTSPAGISPGQTVAVAGVPIGTGGIAKLTKVAAISGSTVTLTLNATGTVGSADLIFTSAPPIAPITTDSPTCGGATDCPVPVGTLLCITGRSPLTLGAPTSLDYSCSGATAMAISDTGAGFVWLKKPARLWGDPTNLTWNTSQSSGVVNSAYFNAIESEFTIYSNISNAAGTGPAKKGDSSFVISSITVSPRSGTAYTSLPANQRKNHSWDLAQNGDWFMDDASGKIWVYGAYDNVSWNVTWKTLSQDPFHSPNFTTTGGCQSGKEFLAENSDIRFLYGKLLSGINVFYAGGYCNTTGVSQFRYEFNTDRYTSELFHIISTSGTALNPVPWNSNAHYSTNANLPGSHHNDYPFFAEFYAGSTYLDFSNNYIDSSAAFVFAGGAGSDRLQFPGITFTNNIGYIEHLYWNQWVDVVNKLPDFLSQRNRITFGYGDLNLNGAIETNIYEGWAGTPNHPAISEWNWSYADFRNGVGGPYSEARYNLINWAYHHGIVYGNAAYIPGIRAHHNICAEKLLDDACISTGYDGIQLVDSPWVYSNSSVGATHGLVTIGDIGDASQILIVGLRLFDNIARQDLNQAGFTQLNYLSSTTTNNFAQYQMVFGGFNSLYGLGANYGGPGSYSGPVPPNLVDPTFRRISRVIKGGVNYYDSPAHNITGVALQNASYSGNSVVNGTLTWTYVSPTNITVAWDDGLGSGPGTPVQLNWGGSGQTYQSASISDAAEQLLGIMIMPGSWGTPTDAHVGCPQTMWAKVTTGAAAGKFYMLAHCGDSDFAFNGFGGVPQPSNKLTIVPDPIPNGYIGGDSFIIYQSAAVLHNGDNTQTITLTPDYRLTPSSTQTDTGISVSLTDYCASGCSATLDTGIPGASQNDASSFLWGTFTGAAGQVGTNSPVDCGIVEPLLGGDMTAAWRTGSCYAPTGTAWLTAGHPGLNGQRGPIGATVLTLPVVSTGYIP